MCLGGGSTPAATAPPPAAPAPAPVNAAGDTEGSSGSMPAVGTDERKAEYDRRGWAYDDTIPGHGETKSTKTTPTTPTDSESESSYVDRGIDYVKGLGSKYGLF